MNTTTKSGTTLAEREFVEGRLRGGWTAMWFATLLSPLFPISIFLAMVGLGRGIGAATWPGYGRRGWKLAFWSVMGPLTPWILFIAFALLSKKFR